MLAVCGSTGVILNSADSFTYDGVNRLKTATVAGTTETSTYDGDGVRFSRQVGAGPVIATFRTDEFGVAEPWPLDG